MQSAHNMQTPGAGLSSAPPSMLDPLSLLAPIGYQSSRCGYCSKGSQSSGSFSYYVSARSLTVHFYEDLLHRGWRRSGTLLYKPDQKASCCPHYTIRLDSLAFKPTKDQRQALNRFNRFVLGEKYISDSARIHPRSKAETARRKSEFSLPERVHESEKLFLKVPPEPAHDLKVTLETDDFTEEKYTLFENYQRIVHKEPPNKISKSGFRRFLCSSPLGRSKKIFDGKERDLGSYHQCYRIDGQLVAIGVLDLLPNAVSAVYFMYHEDIHKWSPGKIGALREAALAAEEGYRWYMMGYYIHSCVKMRYKGDYHPQQILDPESYAWDLLDDDLRRRLDDRKYVSLSNDRRHQIAAADQNGTEKCEPPNELGSHETHENDMSDNFGDNDDDDDDDEESSLSLFDRGMPGIMTRSELETLVDLDSVKLSIRDQIVDTGDLVIWDSLTLDDPQSIKSVIAHLVAAIGPGLATRVCVSFG